MDVLNLAELLLSPDEKNELHSSMELLEQSDYSAFYEKNQSIIQSILFLETLEEFLDFSKENELYADTIGSFVFNMQMGLVVIVQVQPCLNIDQADSGNRFLMVNGAGLIQIGFQKGEILLR